MATNHVGIVHGGESQSVEPIKIDVQDDETHVLGVMSVETHKRLVNYLTSRLDAGNQGRNARLERYAQIDRLISTWQTLNANDSKREQMEDLTGRQQGLPMNLPLLATHLDDLTSYFAEVFAPISGDFYTSSGEEQAHSLVKKFNDDSRSRNHYANVTLAFRSALKYNIHGFHIDWEPKGTIGSGVASAGNRWTSLDVYNTIWDPAIEDLRRIPTEAEWAATVDVKNRLWLLRQGLAGNIHRVREALGEVDCDGRKVARPTDSEKKGKYYRPAPAQAGLPTDTLDSKTRGSDGPKVPGGGSPVDWNSYGVGLSSEGGYEIKGYERVLMYCWIKPHEFDLLTKEEVQQAEKLLGSDPESFLELWRFQIIDGHTVIDASPVVPRTEALQSAQAADTATITGGEIPIYMDYFTLDQMKAAQRSVMELLRGFQRLGSYLTNIYVAGLRKNIWGLKAYDPTGIDAGKLEEGAVAGAIPTKVPGRDVRTLISDISTNTGVDDAMNNLAQVLNLVKEFAPSQALPSQVAGIDRAVKNQVSAVMQGAQRKLQMLARLADSLVYTPARLACYRNYLRYDPDGIRDLKDEEVARVLGSGIEAMNSERVVEILREIIFAIMQNQEAHQAYDVPGLMAYMSRVMNIGVDLGSFVKQPPVAPPAPGGVVGSESAPGAPGVDLSQLGM